MNLKNYAPGMLITAGLVYRAWHLTSTPVWYDEAFTVLVSRLPLGGLLAATAGDVHPPLYYLLLAALFRILPSLPAALVIRGSSLLLGLGSLVLFWKLTSLLGLSSSARLAALGLLTWLPSEIFYQQEGRMYALLQLLTLGQVYFMYKRQWAALGLVSLLAFYTHNYALIYTAALGGAALVGLLKSAQPKAARGLVLSLGAAGLGWLPWGWVLLGQMSSIKDNYWIQPLTPGGLLVDLLRIWGGLSIPPAWIIAIPMGLAAGLGLLVNYGIQNKRYFLLAWLLGPVVLVVLLSIGYRSIFLYRGFYPGLPALAALAGESFSLARPGAARLGRWALLLPWGVLLVWMGGLNILGIGKGGEYWPPQQPAPVVIHLDDSSYISGRYLWPGAHHYLLAAGCPQEPGALTEQTRAALGYEYMPLPSLPPGAALAASLGPLATPCHEQVYQKFTRGSQALYKQVNPFGEYGLWQLKP